MKINYHKNFSKKFKKLPFKLQEKVKSTIKVFRRNPFDPRLYNHKLRGRVANRRAVAVTGDIRIIFEEYGGYVVVIMLNVGGHSQVYN